MQRTALDVLQDPPAVREARRSDVVVHPKEVRGVVVVAVGRPDAISLVLGSGDSRTHLRWRTAPQPETARAPAGRRFGESSLPRSVTLRQSVTAGPSAVCHADFTAMHSELRENVPLAPHTTIGLGGDARYFWDCASESELREALQFGVERRLPIQVLGGGSNMIFSDAGYPGLVVKIGIQGAALQEAGDAVLVQVAAGADWDALVREAVDRGLAGIECLSGIPGTVGGTPVQNVGAYGQEIAETLVSVTCLDRASLERRDFRADECGFAYRQSRFKREDRDRYIILEVTLRLRRQGRPSLRYAELAEEVRRTAPIEALAPAAALGAVRAAVLALRRKKSMVLAADDPNSRSVGSFFVNPVLPPGAFEALQGR